MSSSEAFNGSAASAPSLQVDLLVLLFFALVGGVFYYFTVKAPVTNPPIPAGHVVIRVDFKGISTEKYNDLMAFLRKLAENHTDRVFDDFNGSHGYWNDGFVARRYRPNHPIPSPDVEQSMATQFESFLKTNGIDGRGEKLELRYGQ